MSYSERTILYALAPALAVGAFALYSPWLGASFYLVVGLLCAIPPEHPDDGA